MSEITDLKFCNTCKHYGPQNTCTNPTPELDFARQDMVTGKPVLVFCQVVRSSSFLCGHTGKWHEVSSTISAQKSPFGGTTCKREGNICCHFTTCIQAKECIG